jgi:DNA-binding transcriptional LysR family regulator
MVSRRGALVPIRFAAAAPSEHAIWAVYPSARLVLPKLRVFVAAVEQVLAGL